MTPIKLTFQKYDQDIWAKVQPLLDQGHSGPSAIKTLIRELITMERVICLAVQTVAIGQNSAPILQPSVDDGEKFGTSFDEINIAALEAME